MKKVVVILFMLFALFWLSGCHSVDTEDLRRQLSRKALKNSSSNNSFQNFYTNMISLNYLESLTTI